MGWGCKQGPQLTHSRSLLVTVAARDDDLSCVPWLLQNLEEEKKRLEPLEACNTVVRNETYERRLRCIFQSFFRYWFSGFLNPKESRMLRYLFEFQLLKRRKELPRCHKSRLKSQQLNQSTLQDFGKKFLGSYSSTTRPTQDLSPKSGWNVYVLDFFTVHVGVGHCTHSSKSVCHQLPVAQPGPVDNLWVPLWRWAS